MASAVVAGEAADMDQPGKLPEEAAAGSPAARVGEWQPCVAEQDIATVVEGDNSLDRALGELDRIAEGDTRRGRDNEFPPVHESSREGGQPPPFLEITYRIVRLLVGISARAIGIVGGWRILTLTTRICVGGRRVLAPAIGVSVGMAGHWGVYEERRKEERRRRGRKM
jgi:hypothetical protein